MPPTVSAKALPPTRPLLTLYIAWHPQFAEGQALATAIFEHYRGVPYQHVAGGAGVHVEYRSLPVSGEAVPSPIAPTASQVTAVVLLIDEAWVSAPEWVEWAGALAAQADQAGLTMRVFPVALDARVLAAGLQPQAIRWDHWTWLSPAHRLRRLVAVLSYQLCRMLRLYLESLTRAMDDEEALEQYLERVRIFLSHSKHDTDGEALALRIRTWLFATGDLSSFFDVYDIPAGLPFDRVLLQRVRVSVMIAIHSDTYSSREWCRREVLEAKRAHVPLVVANALHNVDERSFPYLGNVPVVRIQDASDERIELLVSRLLDEVLRSFLWRCRVELVRSAAGRDVTFLPRSPELIALTGVADPPGLLATVVYPDPPLGAEEQRLFATVAPQLKLRSMTEWLAEIGA